MLPLLKMRTACFSMSCHINFFSHCGSFVSIAGKTMIGKAIAHESGATFFNISSSSLTSKWIGEGEKLVRTLFAVAHHESPAVVFIDEVDSLLTQRKADENEATRRIKTEFLVQLDGAGNERQGRVLIVGATNLPHELDDAARRRFVKKIYIPLPDQPARVQLFKNLMSQNVNTLKEKHFVRLARDTEGFSGSDLRDLCHEAAMGPLRDAGETLETADGPPLITYKHFRQAIRSMKPSVSSSDLDVLIKWNDQFGNTVAIRGDESCESDISSDDEPV